MAMPTSSAAARSPAAPRPAPLDTTTFGRVSQERTNAEYQKHLYDGLRKKKSEDKENFKRAHAELTQGTRSPPARRHRAARPRPHTVARLRRSV